MGLPAMEHTLKGIKMSAAEVIPQKEKQSQLTLIRPVATPKELIEYHENLRRVIKDSLIEGRDYGKVPGTDKPSLLKPGAEKICIAFGCSPKYELVSSEVDHDREFKWKKKKKIWNNAYKGDRTFRTGVEEGVSLGIYRYLYRSRIVRSDDRVLGEGDGICSTLEGKFIDRPRECENNVCKMAQKRAFIAATLNAFGLSDCFTQDMEDHHAYPEATVVENEDAVSHGQPSPLAKEVFSSENEDHKKLVGQFFEKKHIDAMYLPEFIKEMNGRSLTLSEMEKVRLESGL